LKKIILDDAGRRSRVLSASVRKKKEAETEGRRARERGARRTGFAAFIPLAPAQSAAATLLFFLFLNARQGVDQL
jgi:hypothetical protein